MERAVCPDHHERREVPVRVLIANAYSYSNRNSYSDVCSNRHTYCYGNCYCYSDVCSNRHTYCYGHCYGNCYCCAYSHSYANSNPDPDALHGCGSERTKRNQHDFQQLYRELEQRERRD
jgi:hypothetical protein